MPSGFQVWDADGNLIIDITTRMGRIIGSFSANTTSGSYTDVRLSFGVPFAFPQAEYEFSNGLGLSTAITLPSISISGNTITWTRKQIRSEPLPACLIYFGVN